MSLHSKLVLRRSGSTPARASGGGSRSTAATGSRRIAQGVQAEFVVGIHRGDVRPVGDRIGAGKRRGDRLRHLARRGPLRAALQRDDKPDATQRVDIVTEGRVKDSALTVAEHHEDRLVMTAAVVLRIGVRRCQHRHVFTRPAQAVIKLVALVHPYTRQSLGDGMVVILNRNREGHAVPVAAGGPGFVVRYQAAILKIPEGAGLLISSPPSADSDHLVEGAPTGERVVGSMHAY